MGNYIDYRSCTKNENNEMVKGGYRNNYTGTETEIYHIALKNPYGVSYIYYDPLSKKFTVANNIQDWLSAHYSIDSRPNWFPWKHWIVYNDEPAYILNKSDSTFVRPKETAGHCKGILAWNDYEMSWLIHSVPCFPAFFCPEASGGLENVFSEMRTSEEIYGQSFAYFYLSWGKDGMEVGDKRIRELLEHIRVMEPCIYLSKEFWGTSYSDLWRNSSHSGGNGGNGAMGLHRWVGVEGKWEHYAKSPYLEEDFYEELAKQKGGCRVESWIRGQKVANSSLVSNNLVVYSLKPSVSKNKSIQVMEMGYEFLKFTENQDHSIWAVSNYDGLIQQVMNRDSIAPLTLETDKKSWVMIGDLNRMYSQWKRGGGGMIIWDADLRKAWNTLLTKP
jgi:hypothetical protein